MIGPLLVVVGLLGLWALAKGKANGVLDAIITNGFSTSLQNSLGNTQLGVTQPAATTGSPGIAVSPQQSKVSLYTVPIIGPDGSAGTITVDANSAAAARLNAAQGNNTVTGPAVPVA
jgi:hypothetical protein